MGDQDFYLYDLSWHAGYYGRSYALGGTPNGGGCLWQFTGKEWKLLKDTCAAGYESAGPPKEPGTYRGEIRKTLGVLRETNKGGHASGQR